MRQHVLDANALYRYLTDGDGANTVRDVFKRAAAGESPPVMMSLVNWGEVFYTLVRHIGFHKAERLLNDFREKVQVQLMCVEREDAECAARIKARHNLPYADAYAAALAGNERVLVTADVDHFARVPKLRILKLPRHANP